MQLEGATTFPPRVLQPSGNPFEVREILHRLLLLPQRAPSSVDSLQHIPVHNQPEEASHGVATVNSTAQSICQGAWRFPGEPAARRVQQVARNKRCTIARRR